MANTKCKYETIEELRAANRKSFNKWYSNPENAEKKKAQQRERYQQLKARKEAEKEANK